MNYKEQLIVDINKLYKENEITNTSFIDSVVNSLLEESPNDELIRGIFVNWQKRSKSIELIWDINQFELFEGRISYRISENKTSWSIKYLFDEYDETHNENKTFIEHLHICLNAIKEVYNHFFSKLETKGELYDELISKVEFHIGSSLRDKTYNSDNMVLGIDLDNFRPIIGEKDSLLNHDIYDLKIYMDCFSIYPNDDSWELKDDAPFWSLAEKYIQEEPNETRESQIKKIEKISSNEFYMYFYQVMYKHLAYLNDVKHGSVYARDTQRLIIKYNKKRYLGIEPYSLKPFIGILEGLDGCDLYDLEKFEKAFLIDDKGFYVSVEDNKSEFIIEDKSLINLLVEKYFTDKVVDDTQLPLLKKAEEHTINDDSAFIKVYKPKFGDNFSFSRTNIVGKYSDISHCEKFCYRPKILCEYVELIAKTFEQRDKASWKAMGYFLKAKEHKRNKEYKPAITALEKAITLLHKVEQIGYPEMHSCLIDCYAKIKDKENQIRVLKLAIELYDSPKYKRMLNRIMGTINDTLLINDSHGVVAECNYGEMYDKHVRQKLPEFSFGKKDINWDIYERADMLPVIRKIDRHFQYLLDEAKEAEQLECYDKAVAIYERLIAEGIYTPTAYNRLIVLYSKSKRNNDLIRILQTGINFFETRKSSQAEYLRSLAKKYNAENECERLIQQGEKVRYYCGYIVLYQDYPFINKWKQRLKKLLALNNLLGYNEPKI